MPSERNDPGETVFTRISSGASDSDRFLLMLVIAAFDAVYATSPGDWRFVEWAETLTIRPQSAARNIGRHARVHRTALIVPISKVAAHSSSVSASSDVFTPTSTGPTALTSVLTTPPHASVMVANAASI